MSSTNKKKAVVLCSGGLDSTTVLYYAIDKGYDVYPISFNYKQRHVVELSFVKKTMEKLGLIGKWKVFNLNFTQIQASALTDGKLVVPGGRKPDEMEGIPITYVPLRNTIFLSYAAAYAEALDIQDIFIGVNAIDYSGYPDCRPEYIESMEKAINKGSRYVDDESKEFKIHVPLIEKTKSDIITLGLALGVDYDFTWSCYDPQIQDESIKPCGTCDSCILRKKGFEELEAK
ncbi:MAG: 7-cyano-7-deazaguanine synthase QueC [Candidatus Hodarchaeota archaeon]